MLRRATLFLPTDSFPWIARKDTPSFMICIAPLGRKVACAGDWHEEGGDPGGPPPSRRVGRVGQCVRRTANGFCSGCLPSWPSQIRPTGSLTPFIAPLKTSLCAQAVRKSKPSR